MLKSKMKIKKKAVTPVIAVVLLMMMTVAVGGGVFLWISKTTKEWQKDVNDKYEDIKNEASANLKFISSQNESGNISLILENSGDYPFSAEQINNCLVYKDNIYQNKKVSDYFNVDCEELGPGDTCILTSKKDKWPSSAGNEFEIKIYEQTTKTTVVYYCRLNKGGQQSC